MHKIDGPGATIDNLFTDGDPGVPTAATDVIAKWLNAVQGELVAIAAALGLTLDDLNNSQIADALFVTKATGDNTTSLASTAFVQAAISALVDASPGALDTLNELAAALGDDANFATTVNAALAARLQLTGGTMTGLLTLGADPTETLHAATKKYVDANIVAPGLVLMASREVAPSRTLIADGSAVSRTTYAGLHAYAGTFWGVGDGSATFNLPDFRGYFFRGLDSGAGIDSGRAFGSFQMDAFKLHEHRLRSLNNLSGGPGNFNENQLRSGQAFSDSDLLEGTGDTETRPRNVALVPVITY